MGTTKGRWLTELRLSNAAGKHLDKRTKRLRTRGTKKSKAIADSRDGK